MSVDVILVTESGIPLGEISQYRGKEKYGELILVDFNKSEDGLSLRVYDLQDGTHLSVVKAFKYQTLSAAISKAVSLCQSRWVFIANDADYETARHISYLEAVAETLPRLVSLRPTDQVGLHNVHSNPVFGTLFKLSVLRSGMGFDPTVSDLSVVAYEWARQIADRGWAHMACYVEGLKSSPPIVSDLGLDERHFGESHCDDYLVPKVGSTSGWAGNLKRKPWHHKVTVVIPHYGKDLRLLINILESWRLQFEKPYILIYDIGTPSEHHPSLRALSAADTEVHFCRWHGMQLLYEGVAMAYNYGMVSCRTRHLIFTHDDVVPLSQTVISDLMSGCTEETPVVGYESLSKDCVSTTLTMVHMPTMRRIRAGWDVNPPEEVIEKGFTQCLNHAGIKPRFIGKEKNHRTKTPHFDHVSHLVTTELYHPNKVALVHEDRDSVIKDAEDRLLLWRGA